MPANIRLDCKGLSWSNTLPYLFSNNQKYFKTLANLKHSFPRHWCHGKISYSVRPWQALPPWSKICGWGQKPTIEGRTWKMVPSGSFAERSFRCSIRIGYCPANIRLDCKGLLWTNTTAYLFRASKTWKKHLITLSHFTFLFSSLTLWQSKLPCLSLARHFGLI
jgi:hypothetical protein